MRVLSLDTTGRYCSAAIVDDVSVIARASDKIDRGHAEHLAPQVQNLFQTSGLTMADIDRIAVCTGPGSFTGLRVGIAMAKGLALPRKTPVIGLSALKVWAAIADPESVRRVLSIADVRRGEVFWQVFDKGYAQSAPELSSLGAARKQSKADSVICGNGAPLLTQNAAPTGFVDPAILGWLSMHLDPKTAPPMPLYHRAPDAKLPGGIMPAIAK